MIRTTIIASAFVIIGGFAASAADGTKGTCSARCAAAATAQGTPVGTAPVGYHDPASASAKAAASPSSGRSRGGKGH